ncbi:cdkn1a interacting zinc finger protein 1a [Brienomyrus brachyistius]|uniref:cdkn1a interacting zinc finger protein 1a n=1 Tax=Brienomyrus brachyistius TaxID=42636 RepID=UPI0020B22BB9|nr:cdkn1a interacting zinc finger protein 1a [Brienomyrus brachyistius]
MFSPHQQQQHLRQLQQLFQQHPPPPQGVPSHHVPHQHQGGRTSRPLAVPVPPPPPPVRVVSLGHVPPAAIIAPNPMLQGALLMQQVQGNIRGFAIGGHQFPQFFPAGARPSLLGPVSLAVANKTPLAGFPARTAHPHTRYRSNDFVARQMERMRESEQPAARVAGTDEGAVDRAVCREEVVAVQGAQTQLSPRQQEEPPAKKQRSERPEEQADQPPRPGADPVADARAPWKSAIPEVRAVDSVCRGTLAEGGSTAGPESVEESKAAGVLSGAASHDPVLQPDNESRAFAAGPGAPPVAKEGTALLAKALDENRDTGGDASRSLFCYICSIACLTQQSFRSHMTGLTHQRRMMEIQHASSACLVTLLPHVQESLLGMCGEGEGKPFLKRWRSTCQVHLASNLASRSACLSCTVCRLRFQTPYRFMKHMESLDHQQRMLALHEEGGASCLADGAEGPVEEDYEGEAGEDEDEGSFHSQEGINSEKEVILEDMGDNEEYDQDTQYGPSFMVPVSGFLCRLCRKFYDFNSKAWSSHCKSQRHFKNVQKYRGLRQIASSRTPNDSHHLGDREAANSTKSSVNRDLDGGDNTSMRSDRLLSGHTHPCS